MNIQNILEIVTLQLPMFLSLTWKAAAEKAAIYKAIDNTKGEHDSQISLLDKTISLLIQESHMERASLEDKVSSQGKRFDSKFERLEKKVDDVFNYKVIIQKLDGISDKIK